MDNNLRDTEFIERFSMRWRLQHSVLLISFIMLAATGLALRYDTTWFGRLMVMLEGGFESRGILHRIFAILSILLAFYHSYYVVLTEEGHRELMKLKPAWKDILKLKQAIAYLFNMSNRPPAYGKYNIVQKIQYFGVVAGLILMIATGFILWFESSAMLIIPLWLFQVTWVVHGAEGLLIFLILFLWHMYNVHLNPEVFPMSRKWLDGKISKNELKSNHPEELQELTEEGKIS